MMNRKNEVAKRIEKIMETFLYAQFISKEVDDPKLLSEKLDEIESEFRSVAYEAASMTLAAKDFESVTDLKNWKIFLHNYNSQHSAQIYAGLGWAIAHKRIPATKFIETLDPLMSFRVIDGCGYYDGVFRQRLTIGSQHVPVEFQNNFQKGYDQGVGRALWYISKGEIEKIPKLISPFRASRHADLWRGIGIACAYVGGCDAETLTEIFDFAGTHSSQLSISAALVARARFDASAISPNIELACCVWCNRSAYETMQATVRAEKNISASAVDAYKSWITTIEEELSLINSRMSCRRMSASLK